MLVYAADGITAGRYGMGMHIWQVPPSSSISLAKVNTPPHPLLIPEINKEAHTARIPRVHLQPDHLPRQTQHPPPLHTNLRGPHTLRSRRQSARSASTRLLHGHHVRHGLCVPAGPQILAARDARDVS